TRLLAKVRSTAIKRLTVNPVQPLASMRWMSKFQSRLHTSKATTFYVVAFFFNSSLSPDLPGTLPSLPFAHLHIHHHGPDLQPRLHDQHSPQVPSWDTCLNHAGH